MSNLGWTKADREADAARYAESKAREAAARAAESKKSNQVLAVIAAVVAIVVIGGAFLAFRALSSNDDSDGSATLACRHYGNVAQDVADGRLTGPELRSKIKQIDETASTSDTPGIASNAERMLAAITAGDLVTFKSAASAFASACDSMG